MGRAAGAGHPPFPSTITTKSAWGTRAANFPEDAPLALSSWSERADGLYPSFSEAANFDEEKLERAI